MNLLRGNKEISAHLKITERTLRDWAKRDPLLAREIVKTQGTVYAFAEYLDRWVLLQRGNLRQNAEIERNGNAEDAEALDMPLGAPDIDTKKPVTSELPANDDRPNASTIRRANRGKRSSAKAGTKRQARGGTA